VEDRALRGALLEQDPHDVVVGVAVVDLHGQPSRTPTVSRRGCGKLGPSWSWSRPTPRSSPRTPTGYRPSGSVLAVDLARGAIHPLAQLLEGRLEMLGDR
jgi:hypothetical protein